MVWFLDAHPHADHLSAAPWRKEQLGAPTTIGEQIGKVQRLWKGIYELPDDFPTDGGEWDWLFADGDAFMMGKVPVRVMSSPRHTLASITYVAGDAAFVHDTFMMPDSGTSRADFPGGISRQLYDGIQAILALPDPTRLYVGHGLCARWTRSHLHGDRGRIQGTEHTPERRAVGNRLSAHA